MTTTTKATRVVRKSCVTTSCEIIVIVNVFCTDHQRDAAVLLKPPLLVLLLLLQPLDAEMKTSRRHDG